MKSLFFATTAAVGFASMAMAGSMAPSSMGADSVATSAAAQDWSGLYVGGLVSFDSGDARAIPGSGADLVSTTGFGGFVGYNKQVNALVFGGELAYTTGDVAAVGLPNSFYTDRIDLKGRVGYSFGRVMPYGVVGYSFSDFIDGLPLYPSSGLNYGVGVDVMVTDRIFIGVEYLMRDMSGANGGTVLEGNLDSATIRAGFKF